MGSSEQTTNGIEADAFYARFIDAAPDVIAAVAAERGGDLDAVVAEHRAFGYWGRKIADRRARRDAEAAAKRTDEYVQALRYALPIERARLPKPDAAMLLPASRTATMTGQEQRETRRWWRSLRAESHRNRVVSRMRAETRDAETEQRRSAKRARLDAERWRAEQRAFERAQWRSVLGRHTERRRKQVSNQWAAISEQRALEIALAALEKTTPPLAPK